MKSYDNYILAFSGGKDSLACFLHLLEIGVPLNKIEIWHHEIDGREGSDLMDWPCTSDYCRKFAHHYNVPIYYSWKIGGFECEMLRENSKTQPTRFETPSGEILQAGGIRGKASTRRKFPQVSADLSVRWCSSYLKIDVCSLAIRNQPRFDHSSTLLITGERAEESPSRAKYSDFEVDKADGRNTKKARHVDRWRPVLRWSESEVWDIIKRHKVNPHPAYHLGWGRVSCAACIFGSANQWASLFEINPSQVEKISTYEDEFETTIDRRRTVMEMVAQGSPYQTMREEDISSALSTEYTAPIILDEWSLPAGAFGESCGPI